MAAPFENRVTITQLRTLPQKQQLAWWSSLTPEQADAFLHDWSFLARDEQVQPEGDGWAYWLYLAGRGAGKTRTGAEFTRDMIKKGYKRIGMIAPTSADARDVMVEGESGILSCSWDQDVDNKGDVMGIPQYEPSKRRLTWRNGAQAFTYSADEPERLRGPQHDLLWADELAAWRRPETWDLAMFGLRLGKKPLAFISTTPKPQKLIIDLMKDPFCTVTRGSTYDNRANLPDTFFATIIKKYENTRLGDQELLGIILEEAEGALWTRGLLDMSRKDIPTDKDFYFVRIVVAVDPAITAKTESSETGIIVVGLGNDGEGYIIADYSGTYSPGKWAKKSVAAYRLHKANFVVAEGNQGGEMVRHTIHTRDKNVPVTIVYASRGKAARAEPVAALFEQNRCHMTGKLSQLEDQLCVWEPLSGKESPDRLDAMVWGVTFCMLGAGQSGQGKLEGAY